MLQAYVERVHNNNQSQAAQALGLKPMTLNNWLKRQRTPNLEALQPVFDAMHLQIIAPEDTFSTMDFDYIPKVAAKAGAGASLETSGETLGLYAFRKDYITQQGIRARQSILLDVTGDSMEPLLKSGDTILVDCPSRSGGIFLFNFSKTVYTKYKQMKRNLLTIK